MGAAALRIAEPANVERRRRSLAMRLESLVIAGLMLVAPRAVAAHRVSAPVLGGVVGAAHLRDVALGLLVLVVAESVELAAGALDPVERGLSVGHWEVAFVDEP